MKYIAHFIKNYILGIYLPELSMFQLFDLMVNKLSVIQCPYELNDELVSRNTKIND